MPEMRRRPCQGCGKPVICRTDARAEPKCMACRRADPQDHWAAELRRYGLTPEKWQAMFDAQGGRCGICGKSAEGQMKRFCIDHDHSCCPAGNRSCGKCVRGLLCRPCNTNLERSWENREQIQAWMRRSLRSVVCFDLDSTLASTTHRQYMVPLIKTKQGPTWEDYSMACARDQLVPGPAVIARILHAGSLLHVVSGRSSAARELTRNWLTAHAVPFDHLELRPAGDYTPNGVFKVDYIRRLQADGFTVDLFVEDWKETAEYIHEKTGVPVLIVQGDYLADVDSKGLSGV